jgi:nitrite reductase/ring-hydroxylating ferredoxin subunit/catechol 2,3-dioxygenase-like lactoylglutathione lyase family enzyme
MLFLFTVGSHAQLPMVTGVTITVSDVDSISRFYTDILGAEVVRREADIPALRQLYGITDPTCRIKYAVLRIGNETLALQSFTGKKTNSRPIPADAHSNDLWFQHVALVVGNMDSAYQHLRRHHVTFVSSSPQTLPDYLPNAAGISAFYFRDPDGHNLELIHFPKGKGYPRWQNACKGICCGIDHTAIAISDSARENDCYIRLMGLHVAGNSENYGPEQEHLNQVFGAHLEITGLRAAQGIGVEYLHYLAPPGGRPYPAHSNVSDLWHWHTAIKAADIDAVYQQCRSAALPFISPGLVTISSPALQFTRAFNRRHLGVSMFLAASVHAGYSLYQFHGNGNIHPLLSLFLSNTHYHSFIFFPFQTLGFAAYLILMLMAFTSHDFWLTVLSPRVWKSLHVMVYIAYALLVLHVVLGVLQLEDAPFYYILTMAGALLVATLHCIAAYREWRFDRREQRNEADAWVPVCHVDEIPEDRARMLVIGGERIAVFKYDGKLSAVHNVCKHQNGPLGEGKIVDGCITCPWHGYQYRPEDGCAPPPFTEKVATYRLKLDGETVFVDPRPLPEGTAVPPVNIAGTESKAQQKNDFYIGWQKAAPKAYATLAWQSALLVGLCGMMLLWGITLHQRHISDVKFLDGDKNGYRGQLVAQPFPALRMMHGRDAYGNPEVTTFPLMNAWKFGAGHAVQKILGNKQTQNVVVHADLLEREGVRALTLHDRPDAIQLINDAALPAAKLSEEHDTLIEGMIIDPKCYLGAMNPGEGKPHRSCAIRCIEGGIMPMVVFKGKNGKQQYAVLLGASGEPVNQRIGYAVAEPVALRGKIFSFDNWLVLKVAVPEGIRRLSIDTH